VRTGDVSLTWHEEIRGHLILGLRSLARA
jgi:hypothetical protein